MKHIPLQQLPAQSFDVELENKICSIKLYQRGDYMFMDYAVDGEDVAFGMICLSDCVIDAYPNTKFSGKFGFVDLTGANGAPYWEELEDRYQLLYLAEDDEDI